MKFFIIKLGDTIVLSRWLVFEDLRYVDSISHKFEAIAQWGLPSNRENDMHDFK